MKHIAILLYAIVILVMAMATFVEKAQGTAFVSEHIYGSWWFAALWAVLVAVAVAYIIKVRMRRPSQLALHLSFVVILAGALLTHLTASQQLLHLRLGQPNSQLGFKVTLTDFKVLCHEGTTAPYDYISTFTIHTSDGTRQAQVSMNNIHAHASHRFYQTSYDDDMRGSTLLVSSDPWGIPVTYVGYALLMTSLLWMLLDPKGTFRRTLRESQKVAVLAVLFSLGLSAQAAESLDVKGSTLTDSEAAAFGRLHLNYNNRICPVETFALDFCKTVTGKRSWQGLSATQVLAGYVLFTDEWDTMPVIYVKNKELRDRLRLPEWSSVKTFFDSRRGGYILGPYVNEYYRGNHDAFHKALAELDEHLMLVMQVRRQTLSKFFPYEGTWYAPTDSLPASMPDAQKQYVRQSLKMLASLSHGGEKAMSAEMLAKMHKYQVRYGGASVPSPLRQKAEQIYNALPYTTILFPLCLTLGFLTAIFFGRLSRRRYRLVAVGSLAVCWLLLTGLLALRWLVSGRIPMANGYETMLLMAWLVMLVGLLLHRRFTVMLTFALLLGGFFLLVSHLSQLKPQINHIMPVLQSPLLTIHVSIIMMSYALLSITAICAAVGLVRRSEEQPMMQLSLLMLYPAMACLGIGIFVGAIWANVSWGTYWSWDPKETWALITFMLYAAPMHHASLPLLREPRSYHAFVLLAFLSVIITYFGVNYILGGMHSYA